jgi:uncharacterized protein DUF6948
MATKKASSGGPYQIVRTRSAGVFAGQVVERSGMEVKIKNARRLWYWAGAASLSQLAQSGTSKPKDCKFPEAVASILVTEAIEILDVTEAARASIEAVPIWRA